MLETTGARRFWQIRPQDESAGATYPEQRLNACELYCFFTTFTIGYYTIIYSEVTII